MRIIAIGDTHGRTSWKQIIANETFDKVVFIGDYFDTHEKTISPQQQMANFKDIIAFKEAFMNKVVLLFGNHDFHYLRTTNEHYSGFQNLAKTDIQELLHEAVDKKLLKMCFIHENLLFTHAGLTKTWKQKMLGNRDVKDLSQEINDLFFYQPNSFKFTSGENYSPIGDDITQSPIWVRPNSLFIDGVEGYIQVVGHTQVSKIELKRKTTIKEVVLIDVLGTSGEYLIWNDFRLSVGKNSI